MHLAIWTDRKTGMASMPCSFDSTHGEARFPGVRIMWKRGGNPALMHARSPRDNYVLERAAVRNGCWANQIECPQDARCPEQPTKRRFSVFERTDRPLEPFHFCPIVHLTRAHPQPRRVLQASSCGRVLLRPSGTML